MTKEELLNKVIDTLKEIGVSLGAEIAAEDDEPAPKKAAPKKAAPAKAAPKKAAPKKAPEPEPEDDEEDEDGEDDGGDLFDEDDGDEEMSQEEFIEKARGFAADVKAAGNTDKFTQFLKKLGSPKLAEIKAKDRAKVLAKLEELSE